MQNERCSSWRHTPQVKSLARVQQGVASGTSAAPELGTAGGAHPVARPQATLVSADALPGLAATEHSAEGATLNLEDVRTLHRDRGVVIAAATGIMDPADPLAIFGLHVDEDSFAGLLGIAAEIRAAFLNAD